MTALAIYFAIGLWMSGYSSAVSEAMPTRRLTTVALGLFALVAWPIILAAGAIGSAVEQP